MASERWVRLDDIEKVVHTLAMQVLRGHCACVNKGWRKAHREIMAEIRAIAKPKREKEAKRGKA